MNATTKVDREKWIARADQLQIMDADTRAINHRDVIDTLMREFKISKDSARTASAHAAMRARKDDQTWLTSTCPTTN
jgi:hypothetical protein